MSVLMTSDKQCQVITSLITISHDVKLAEVEGMVTQIWNDGEITSQKCGSLMWRRSLHQHYPPILDVHVEMPIIYSNYSFACVSYIDALRIRIAMGDMKAISDKAELHELVCEEACADRFDP